MDPRTITKLRCPRCRNGIALSVQQQSLQCPSCHQQFHLTDNRFPDFLTPQDRQALDQELAFWKHHFTGTTAYHDESAESYQGWATLFGLTGQEDVLEIGCGSGALLGTLPARLRVGLEPVETLLLPSRGFDGVIGNALDLPFQDASFDVVYFKHSLHHVTSKDVAFIEAIRVLRPSGKLVVIEPNAAHPYRRLISHPDSALRKYKILVKFISPVETFQTADELLAWAEKKGLSTERLLYRESSYERLSFKQRLQKIYRILCAPILPAKYRYPNYFILFRKPLTAHA
jgi:ubiquinone/menaquinone biosynthesis C-methylase UbiE